MSTHVRSSMNMTSTCYNHSLISFKNTGKLTVDFSVRNLVVYSLFHVVPIVCVGVVCRILASLCGN